MNLLIVTPYSQETHVVQWVEAHTPQGSIVIQPEHAPLIITLVLHKNLTFLSKTGEVKSIMLNRPGFLEVTRTGVTALLGQAVT